MCCVSLGLAGIYCGLVASRTPFDLNYFTECTSGWSLPPTLLRVLCQHPSTPSQKVKGPLAAHARCYSHSVTRRLLLLCPRRPSAPALEVLGATALPVHARGPRSPSHRARGKGQALPPKGPPQNLHLIASHRPSYPSYWRVGPVTSWPLALDASLPAQRHHCVLVPCQTSRAPPVATACLVSGRH